MGYTNVRLATTAAYQRMGFRAKPVLRVTWLIRIAVSAFHAAKAMWLLSLLRMNADLALQAAMQTAMRQHAGPVETTPSHLMQAQTVFSARASFLPGKLMRSIKPARCPR